jgi:DNA-binding transcriptional MerR regulator
MEARVRIGELAGRVGVSAKTVRYYEEIGLLPEPERAANGYRVYDESMVERLGFVRDAQASGLTLAEIAAVLEMRDEGSSTCEHVVALLEQHLAGLDAHIEALIETRKELAALTDRARHLDPAACNDPNRCQTIVALRHDPDTAHLHHAPSPHHDVR